MKPRGRSLPLLPVLSLLLVAAACAVGPTYQRPEMHTPQAWAESPAAGAAAEVTAGSPAPERWWTGFHDPTLEGLVARAVEGNLDLEIAAARIREARAAHGIAAAAALPQVSAAGAAARAERSDAVPPFNSVTAGSSPFGPREQSAFEAGFDASWEIDVFIDARADGAGDRAGGGR